jgi:hypothetical protein
MTSPRRKKIKLRKWKERQAIKALRKSLEDPFWCATMRMRIRSEIRARTMGSVFIPQ